jgi:hypothetical protein
MMAWWLLAELIEHRSAWTLPNLLATTFYGESAYRPGFMAATWSGMAGPLVVYCAAGVVFSLIGRERRSGWLLVVIGMGFGLLMNWLFFGVALRKMNPLVHIYAPDRIVMVSHLLYGIAQASYPLFAIKLLPEIPRMGPPALDEQVGRSIS